MHAPSASVKWISPLPVTTKRFEEARALPSLCAHAGDARPTGNSYFSVTAPSPGTRPEPVRAAHSSPGAGGEQAPRFEFKLSSALRASSLVANFEPPVAAAAAAPSRITSPAETTPVRSARCPGALGRRFPGTARLPPVPFISDLQFGALPAPGLKRTILSMLLRRRVAVQPGQRVRCGNGLCVGVRCSNAAALRLGWVVRLRVLLCCGGARSGDGADSDDAERRTRRSHHRVGAGV